MPLIRAVVTVADCETPTLPRPTPKASDCARAPEREQQVTPKLTASRGWGVG